MFPQSRVNVLLGQQIVAMPALIVIGLWIALQLFSEVGAIANTNETSDVGGVAYMAHIGGFLAGFLLTFLFRGTIAPPNVNAPSVLTHQKGPAQAGPEAFVHSSALKAL